MSKAGQSNIRGINAQVRAAMSLYLQHMGDSKFSHIQLEEPRLGDFFLTFNDGHKIICEVKDCKARFSYADLRSLVRDIVRKKILNDNDEILIICKNLDKRLKDSVHNIKYFKDLVRPNFEKKKFSKTEIDVLDRVRFWVTTQEVNEKIILYLFSELINFWLPETYIKQILDKILIEKIYEGSAKGQIYKRQDILDEIESLRKTIVNDSGYFDQQKVNIETQLSKILEAIKNNEAPEWSQNQLASISAQPNLIYFVLAKFRGEKIDNLEDWDGLWKLNRQYKFSFDIFKIFEANRHTKINQDYIFKFITKNIPELRGFYREDYFDFEVVDLVNKILDQNKSHLEGAFCIAKELLKKYDRDYFYIQKGRDAHYNKENVCKLLERIYGDASGALKRKIYELIVKYFNLIEDQGEFSHYTPREIFRVLYSYLAANSNDFEDRFLKLTKEIIAQFDKFYLRFGKKVRFEGWELMGGVTSGWGRNYKVDDRHFVQIILIPAIRNYYDKKPTKAWSFISKYCINATHGVSRAYPDFLNRAILPIIMERYKNSDVTISSQAFDILREFILSRKGIPHKAELIYQDLRGNYSAEKKMALLEISINKYEVPMNPFVEEIVSSLAEQGNENAKAVLLQWSKNKNYYEKTGFLGNNIVQNIQKIINTSFDDALVMFDNYIQGEYFIHKLDNFDAYEVAGLLNTILKKDFTKGLQFLNRIVQKDKLSKNEQILVSHSILGSGEDKSEEHEFLSRVYDGFLNHLLNSMGNDVTQIQQKFYFSHAREAFVQIAERLAKGKKINYSLRIIELFINDPDPYMPGADPDDPESKYSYHRKIAEEGAEEHAISSVRGWCAWTLAQCAVLDGRPFIERIIGLTEKLVQDQDFYIKHMACFPLSQLARIRLSHMPENREILFFNDDIKVALQMSKRVEQIAFSLLDTICAESLNVKKGLAKSILSVFDHIRVISENRALELVEKLIQFPDDAISEIAPLVIYFAEFREGSFVDWRWKIDGFYDDLQSFDGAKFKKILKDTMLRNAESRSAFSWEFYRLTDGALRKIKHSLDYEEAFNISLNYLKDLLSEYDHRTYEHIYRFIEENIEQPGKFDLCCELWSECLKKEKLALESFVNTKNINDFYWWPYHYNGKILLLVKQHKGDDSFLDIFKLLTEYPKEVNIGDIAGAVALLKAFPKNNTRVEQIFSALVERNSNYFHDKQEWMMKQL